MSVYVKEQRDCVPYISVDSILYCALRVHHIKRQIFFYVTFFYPDISSPTRLPNTTGALYIYKETVK